MYDCVKGHNGVNYAWSCTDVRDNIIYVASSAFIRSLIPLMRTLSHCLISSQRLHLQTPPSIISTPMRESTPEFGQEGRGTHTPLVRKSDSPTVKRWVSVSITSTSVPGVIPFRDVTITTFNKLIATKRETVDLSLWIQSSFPRHLKD